MKYLKLSFLLLLFSGSLALARAGTKDKTLDVYWIDSEGGGSTLIVTPSGESVLIDTGNPGGRDAARIVAAAKAAGLDHLDYVLLTHFHVDHFGGGAEIAAQLPIRTIYQRAIPDGDPDQRATSSFPLQIKPWREIAARREALAPGVTIPLQADPAGPKLTLRCVAADKKVVAASAAQARHPNPLAGTVPAHEIAPSDNDNSAVFVLAYGDFRFFDGGDLTWNYEAKLVEPVNLIGRVDVYQTNHHGLEVSNNLLLVQSLAPSVSVMNNGPRKGGKAEVFATLQSVPLQARYQVHKSMNVPAATNAPDAFIANLEEAKPADQCTAHFITMSVAPDGKNYTFSIPANGHTATYATTAKAE